MTTLQVLSGAYRATYEEQDDTVLWLTQAIAGAGAKVSVLLRGNAVNYAVRDQRAPALAIGTWRQTHAPAIADDVARMVAAGIRFHAVQEDAEERGVPPAAIAEGVRLIRRSEVADLVRLHERVWFW